MAKAEGTFSLDRFDAEDPYDDHDGVKIARAHISKTFAGDLAGTSETDLITVSAENPAAFTCRRASSVSAAIASRIVQSWSAIGVGSFMVN